jgi:hypothetical protein
MKPLTMLLAAAISGAAGLAQETIPAGVPVFRYHAVVLDASMLKYRPHDDVIFPSVVRVGGRVSGALGKFYMYYSAHDVPGGICLAYADKPEGPWREYEHNPVIAREWSPHYRVSHVAGPDAVWSETEHKLLLYYHGENPVTRVASSADGVHFTYEGEAVTTGMFKEVSEASYGRVFEHRLPGKDNTWVMLLMGNNRDTRRIYLAWSKDGRKWEARPTPVIDPPPGTDQAAAAVLVHWAGTLFVVLHANNSKVMQQSLAPARNDAEIAYLKAQGVENLGLNLGFDLYLFEMDAALDRSKYVGKFYDHSLVSPTNPGVMSPCFIEDGGRWYMFFNTGARLHNKIALAIAEPVAEPPARKP